MNDKHFRPAVALQIRGPSYPDLAIGQSTLNTRSTPKLRQNHILPFHIKIYNTTIIIFVVCFFPPFSLPFTLQKTTYLYKMRRKERSKNCGSCSYPPTQSNSFLGICFTKLLIKLKISLNIYSWGYLGGPPNSS